MKINFLPIELYCQNKKKNLIDQIKKISCPIKIVDLYVQHQLSNEMYVRGKAKDCQEVGVEFLVQCLSPQTTFIQLKELIFRYNTDPSVDGIMVQLPLPKTIDCQLIKLLIDPNKDVDGLHPLSLFQPCTPLGIINYLHDMKYSIAGKTVLVIGRSEIVGKPAIRMFLQENANLLIAHSYTPRQVLQKFILLADIIIVAVGKKHFLNKETWKFNRQTIIFDVGINVVDGVLYGDCQPGLTDWQSPVPKGVGLLTRVAVLQNAYFAHLRNEEKNKNE